MPTETATVEAAPRQRRATTWTTVWTVVPKSGRLRELTARNLDVMLRRPPGYRMSLYRSPRGMYGVSVRRVYFEEHFGVTPAEAIDKYEQWLRLQIADYRAIVRAHRRRLRLAAALRTTITPAPEPAPVATEPTEIDR